MDRDTAVSCASLIKKHFLNRTDKLCFAAWETPSPVNAGEQLDQMLAAHLLGDQVPEVEYRWGPSKDGHSGTRHGHFRLGSYGLSNIDCTTRFAVLDYDGGKGHADPIVDPLAAAMHSVRQCDLIGLPRYIEKSKSGAGWHLWLFFSQPIQANLARILIHLLAPTDALLASGKAAGIRKNNGGIDDFPAQDAVLESGYGNQCWLPWFHGAADGCNQFYRVVDGVPSEVFVPTSLDCLSLGDVKTAIAAMATMEEELFPGRREPRRSEQRPSFASDQSRDVAVMRACLEAIPNHDVPYQEWLNIGFAVHHVDPIGGKEDWRAWSQRSSKHKDSEIDKHWRDFSGRHHEKPVTLATLVHEARQRGWTMPPSLRGKPEVLRNGTHEHRDAPPIDDGGECGHSPTDGGGFCNFYEEFNVVTDDKGKEKEVKTVVGYPIRTLHDSLRDMTGGWPKCASGLLFSERAEYKPEWIKVSAELFSWIGGVVSTDDGGNKLRWKGGTDKIAQQQFHAFCVQNCERFEAVEEVPHEPPMSGHYYMHPALRTEETGAFRELANRFSPATLEDGDLIRAAFMTPFAGIESGQRPAFLIQAKDDDKHGGRGAGKTTLAELVGRLCGGHIEMRAGDDWDSLVTRMLSAQALTKRVAILDNVKTLRFSWADFEAGITAAVISGRQLYVGEGRRPNTLTYFVTLNGANMSKDMSQRVVPIILKRPEYDAAWEQDTIRLLDERRWDIISDIILALKTTVAPLVKYTRWSTWEQAVLSRIGDPSNCQRLIEERQAMIDDDQTESDSVREGFMAALTRRGHDPQKERVFIPSETAARIVNVVENEVHRGYNRAMAHLYTLNILEISKKKHDNERGCMWAPKNTDCNTNMVRIKEEPVYS